MEAGLRAKDHEALRAAMGEQNFAEAYGTGRALSEREAVARALGNLTH
jgi:hypothetical protein